MTFNLKIFFVAAASMISVSLMAQPQLKLPASHDSQHNTLIARQQPTINPFKIENNDLLLNSVREREALDMESDIFEEYWKSEHVNPYGNAPVPEHKDIDVSEYQTPCPGHITSRYGYRARFRRNHYGIDLKLQVGDTVRAAFSGKIRITKFDRRGYGYYVVTRHPNGMETVYGHLSKFLVKPDQVVKAGDPIALGGNTGRSTGAHLHFETRYMGIPINPEAIIDFENGVTHKDVFAFDKNTYSRPQKYAPAKKSRVTASKKRTSTRRRTTAKRK